ncbi:MAG TPA: hypothetical protein VHW03_04545 [Chthoniobacterales bacterium]|nr:hypothetical protein [Chthoniobacterales bacterium]
MSDFSDLYARGLLETIAAIGDSFAWNGEPFACILDHRNGVLTTAKSFFTAGQAQPKVGDTIAIGARNLQVKKVGNAGLLALAGGYVEDNTPFIDDPNDPSLDIAFAAFIRK